MKLNNQIETTYDKTSIILNMPIEFSMDSRRPIRFRLPTIRDFISDLGFKKFISLISLTPESIRDSNIPVNFKVDTWGDLIQGLMLFTDFNTLMTNYFAKFIEKCSIDKSGLVVNETKILSYELEYIAHIILVSLMLVEFDIDYTNTKAQAVEKEPELSPTEKAMMLKQKAAEEKLKKAKNKKSSGGDSLTLEEIMLAVSYEFHKDLETLLDINYFSLIWQFGYVGYLDGHKLQQIMFGTGNTKDKKYTYWLNKKTKR